MTSNNSRKRDKLTVEDVRELLYYTPETGKFFWKERPRKYFDTDNRQAFWNRLYAKKETMCSDRDHGYKQGTILGGNYKAHRLAWFYCYGYWPESLDHINGDPADNRIANLREVDQSENVKNMGRTHNNKTGISGVYWCNDRNKWTSRISVGNKTKFLGRYDDFFEACCARKSADVKYKFHENHGRR